MIIDDTPANLDLLTGMLRQKGYRVRPALSGKLAIQAAKNDPPDLILLDIAMPEMSGYEVCEKLKADKDLREIPVIFLSALSETIDKLKAFSLGGVDYITKPFQFEEVHARVKTHLKIRQLQSEVEIYSQKLEELVRIQVKEIFESQMATLFSIVKLAESRDDNTGKHLERVQKICRLIALNLADNPRYGTVITQYYTENIFYASPLHDIGKVAIPDNILLKPGKLTRDEFEKMKAHTIMGAKTLEAVQHEYQKNYFLKMGIEIALFHHEKWDGSGYLSGISGEDIPLSARIMAVADVYDALRSKRSYKEAFPHEKSHEIIVQGSGLHFDPDVVSVFHKNHEQIKAIYDKSVEKLQADINYNKSFF
jgi:putative two-component system response regulator